LLLVVWSSIGLWVVGWVGLWVQKIYFAVGLGQSFGELGWVEESRPMDNSVLDSIARTQVYQTDKKIGD